MFNQTRARIDEKFVLPVQRLAVVAYAALLIGLAALMLALVRR
jgi:hypothetical protein